MRNSRKSFFAVAVLLLLTSLAPVKAHASVCKVTGVGVGVVAATLGYRLVKWRMAFGGAVFAALTPWLCEGAPVGENGIDSMRATPAYASLVKSYGAKDADDILFLIFGGLAPETIAGRYARNTEESETVRTLVVELGSGRSVASAAESQAEKKGTPTEAPVAPSEAQAGAASARP